MSEQKPQEVVSLERGRWSGLEYKCRQFQATIPQEHTIEQIMIPAYWSIVANELTPYNEIRALAEDGSWVAYLIVNEVGTNYARVTLDRMIEMDRFDPNVKEKVDTSDYRVVYRGEHFRWSVKRISDNAWIHEFAQSRGAAHAWLNEHLKACKAA